MPALTARQLRERLNAPADDDWTEVLNDLTDRYGRDALVAFTHAQGEYDEDATLDADDLEEIIERKYRNQWDNAAEFAEHVAEDETECGDPEEAKGRAWFLEHYGRYIDWNAVAESPEIVGSFSMIMLDPENSRTVHAFEMEA